MIDRDCVGNRFAGDFRETSATICSALGFGLSRIQRTVVNVGIETRHERFSYANERRANIPGWSEQQSQHFVVRRLLPHIEFRSFFPFRRNHALDLPSHRQRSRVIEFGLVRIRRLRNLHMLLREKLPRFGTRRSPTAMIIPVCFLAHVRLLEVERSISGFSRYVKTRKRVSGRNR